MFLRILAAFHLDDPASLKRAITTALGGLAILAVNPFLQARGLPTVSDTALELFAGLVAGFVLQSGANSIALKSGQAKVAVAEMAPPTSPVPLAPTSPSTVLGQ